MKLFFIGVCLLLFSCASSAQKKQAKLISIFRQYITGDFDNSNQVLAEIKAGKQIHPLAVHVNRVADDKVINKPKELNGFFIIEESYYLSEGKPLELKPFLFYFSQGEKNKINLTVYQFPVQYKKEEIRNDNKELVIDFLQLKVSPTFSKAVYTWDAANKTFSTNTSVSLPGDMKFSLIETFTNTQLSVMELLEKGGQRITSYSTPILYQRKN